MESILTPPQSFSFDVNSLDLVTGGINDIWNKWKKSYNIYVKACQINEKSADVQFNIFLHVVGEQCREILYQDNGQTISTVEGAFIKLDGHFKCKKNITVERHRFFSRDQNDDESIDHYVFELRRLSQSCDFNTINDEMIRDRLVCGINSSSIRERLLREDDLTLKKALEICRAVVASVSHSENIKKETQPIYQIHDEAQNNKLYITRRQNQAGRGARGGARPQFVRRGFGSAAANSSNLVPQRSVFSKNKRCQYCGGTHLRPRRMHRTRRGKACYVDSAKSGE
ncbi:hypothetical protein ACJJTC_000127 [Scirpophaga incertulas]